MPREHTDKEYESELKRLREQILYMGAKVEEMIALTMRALVERDDELARRMIEFDHVINRLEVDTDGLCLKILARRQPVASDLRFITSALKIVTDLERIGDLGVNIAERVIELNQEPPLKPYVDLPRMAEETQGMVHDALDAFVAGDAGRARAAIARDDVVDAYYSQVFRELLTYMMEDPRNIYRATRVQSIAKYLERIGDHATNLAEMVVFMTERRDIRHQGKLEERPPGSQPRAVLFLCVGNSARSQMAEGLARSLFPPEVRALSAGSSPAAAVHPAAIAAMREIGIDISGQRPKHVDEIRVTEVDLVVTLCGDNLCPAAAPAAHREAWALPDPAAAGGNGAEIEAFRRTRDALRERLERLVAGWAKARPAVTQP
jgi:phosphate transport system protein